MNFKEALQKVKTYMESKKEIMLVTIGDGKAIWSDDYVEYLLEEREFDCTLLKKNLELRMIKIWMIPVNENFDELVNLLDKN